MRTENVQTSVVNKGTNIYNHVVSTDLKKKSKKDLLLELTGKRKTMLEGAVFMLHSKMKFDHLDRALTALQNANNSYGLAAVEAALQTQIDVILDMDELGSTKEEKNLSKAETSACLFTLQNMIYALSDYKFKNGAENDYVPKLLQDQYQMLLKGSTLGLDWDRLNKSAYSTKFRDRNNPVLAKWDFLDARKIQKNMTDMARYQVEHDEKILNNLRSVQVEEPVVEEEVNTGLVDYGAHEVTETPNPVMSQIFSKALRRFDSKSLRVDPQAKKELYNFVKGSVADPKADEYTQYYPVVNDMSLAVMHRLADIASIQQRRAMAEQEQGRSL